MKHRHFFTQSVLGLVIATTGLAQPVPTPTPGLPPSMVTPALPVGSPPPPVGTPASPAATPSQPSASDDLIGPINMPGDSLDAVLGLLERWTGKTLLRPQNLPAASITFILKDRITKAEAIQAVETLLNLNGIAVTPLGNRFLKVTPLNTVKSEAPEYIEGSTLALTPSGRTASKLYSLQFLRVAEFMPQIAGLLNPAAGSPPVVFDKANAALITDSVSNLQRIETLVARLDQPSLVGLTSKFFTLHSAKASDVVNKLHAILTGQLQNQLGSTTTYSADDRTNQIMLIADPRQFAFFAGLIEKLDVKSDTNTRNEVIQLKHAAAKDVADIISKLVTGQNAAAKTAGQENTSRGAQPPAPGPQPGQPTTTPSTPALGASALGLEPGANQFSALLTVLADERSNSLVVSGNVDDIRLIRELVGKIDILLAQVRIEVIIAEVTLSDKDTSGISALNLTVAPNTTTGKIGITNFDTGTGANGIAGWGITGGIVNPLAFKAAMGDTGSKHNVKILSAPIIVTTHNKEGKVAVTQQQPVITSSQSTPLASGTTTAVYSSNSQVTYKDIGITLTVTPLIGDDGSIQLTIDQVVDDVISNVTIDGNAQPIIGHREAKSSVNVYDGQMIVLGGLQRNTHTRDRTKLGFFFEIPIVSHLLGGRNNDVERTELLLFVRPHVLRPEEGTADTASKIEELSNKDQIKQFLADPTKPAKESALEKIK
jgi:general secretion pathway protein D